MAAPLACVQDRDNRPALHSPTAALAGMAKAMAAVAVAIFITVFMVTGFRTGGYVSIRGHI